MCKSMFQGTSIHPVRIDCYVFGLSDLHNSRHAMSPCLGFLFSTLCNCVSVSEESCTSCHKPFMMMSTCLREVCATTRKFVTNMQLLH